MFFLIFSVILIGLWELSIVAIKKLQMREIFFHKLIEVVDRPVQINKEAMDSVIDSL